MAAHHAAARAPPHPALAHLTPTPRLLRLPPREVAEPAPRAPTHLLRPFMAPAAMKAAGVHKEAARWPTSSSPGRGRSTDSSSSDGNWQHASWERTRPAGETHETGDAAPERPAPVAVPGLPWQRPPRTFSPAVTPREAGGGTLPRQSPGKSSSARSSAKRSPSKTSGPDETTGGSPRRAAPDRSVLVPFDDPPFKPERTGPQALPEDVLQVAHARSNPSRPPATPSPHRSGDCAVAVQAARAHYDVPGMLGRTERCYLQVCAATQRVPRGACHPPPLTESRGRVWQVVDRTY